MRSAGRSPGPIVEIPKGLRLRVIGLADQETLQDLQETLARNWHLAISEGCKARKAAKAAKARKGLRGLERLRRPPVCPFKQTKQTSLDGASRGIPGVCP